VDNAALLSLRRTGAVAKRILLQLRNDRRTMALMFAAPIFVLTLMYFVLDTNDKSTAIAVYNFPSGMEERLSMYDVKVRRTSEAEALHLMDEGEIFAVGTVKDGRLTVTLNEENPAKSSAALAALEGCFQGKANRRADRIPTIIYRYGVYNPQDIDSMGPVLIGLIVFFFVFLVAGMSFLQERTSGTLEKLLSTPIRRYEIVFGYLIGFGLFTIAQSVLIAAYCVYVLGILEAGSFALMLFVILCGSLLALSLGTLLSTVAQNEFQMIQFIPLVIVPQVFFSGLFDLSPVMQKIGYVMPLYYIASALRNVMLKAATFTDVAPDAGIILLLTLIFACANVRALKVYRSI
jgi:ABC-2 type transport system permease protein